MTRDLNEVMVIKTPQSTYCIDPVPRTLQLKLLSKDGLEDDVLPPPKSERPSIS